MTDLPPRDPPFEGGFVPFEPCQGTSQAHIYDPGPSGVPLPPPVPITMSGNNPRELRNKVERLRRQNLTRSINELAALLPPIRATTKKIDKNGILRLAAHYLRANNYVFGNSLNSAERLEQLRPASVDAVLQMINGFLITVTYRGLIVVISKNVHQYLGYSEIDLLGQSVFSIVHREDHAMLREQLMPNRSLLGPDGELVIPNVPDGPAKVAQMLANDKRSFSVRFRICSHPTEPAKYVTCHVGGSMRMSDMAGTISSATLVRRARARTENPFASGNDIVFIGAARPTVESFITEREVESFRMEYWTRHSVDGEIIQCETHIALVTGYLTTEVCGVNAMNFMHKDDVPWVVIALRDMYENHRLYGESCYRLITKCGNFVYMKTRGSLEVNPETKAVTSFVCTNTVVDDDEGIKLLLEMKNKFKGFIKNTLMPVEDKNESTDTDSVQIEDPRRLETVILRLITNLPKPPGSHPSNRSVTHLSIIPPQKEKIVSAINKIRTIIVPATESQSFMKNTGMSEVKSTAAISANTIKGSHKGGHGNTLKKKSVRESLLKTTASQRSKAKVRYLNILNEAHAQPSPRRPTLSQTAVKDKDRKNNTFIDSNKIEKTSDNTRLILPDPKQRAQTNNNITNAEVSTPKKSPVCKQQALTNDYLPNDEKKSPVCKQQALTNDYIPNDQKKSPVCKKQALTNYYIPNQKKSPISKQQTLTNDHIHNDQRESPIFKQQALTNNNIPNGDDATLMKSPFSFYIFNTADDFSGVRFTSPVEPKCNFQISELLSENGENMCLDEVNSPIVSQVRQCTSSSVDFDNSDYTQLGPNQITLGIKNNNYYSDHNYFETESYDINSLLLGDIEYNEKKVDIQAITLSLMDPNSAFESYSMDHDDLEGVFQRLENEYADRNKENIQL